MNLNDIREMVSKDLEMDRTELDIESIKTPQLHNKYLILFTDETLLFKKMQSEYKTLRKDKGLYYTGKMGDEELKQRNWEPFPLNVLRADTDQFIESDRELIIQSHRLALQEEKVKYLEGVVKIINNRQWYIRSAIDWAKFSNGG